MTPLELAQFTPGFDPEKVQLTDQSLVDSLNGAGLAGDAYYRFSKCFSHETSQRLQTYWLQQTLLAENYKVELEVLGRAFQSRSIGPVLLKGLSLQYSLYEDLGQRPSNDIDLLIDPQERVEVEALLKKLGYVEKKEARWKWNKHKSNWYKVHQGIPLSVELHWKLFPTLEEGKADIHSVDFKVQPFRCLAPTENLAYLIAHVANQHNFSRLYWLVDIDRFLRLNNQRIHWGHFKMLCKKMAILRSASATFYICRTHFKTPLGNEARAMSHGPWSGLWRQLLTASFLSQPERHPVRYYLLRLLMKDSFKQSLEYFLLRLTRTWKK